MKLLDKEGMRALAMLTQIGINMLVPIALAIWLASVLVPDRPALMIVIIAFGTGVSFRNFYMFAIRESKRRKLSDPRKGRPTDYSDPGNEEEE